MASEFAVVGVPLGEERPPPRDKSDEKSYKLLLALVGVTALLLWCQNAFFFSNFEDTPTRDSVEVSAMAERVIVLDNDEDDVAEFAVVGAMSLTDETFQEVLEEHDFVFIDFFAPWCVWCQRLAPTWTKFASKAASDKLPLLVAMVDCVEQADLCRKQKVMTFPTLRWYQNGRAVAPDYKMDRTVSALVSFSKPKLGMVQDDLTRLKEVADEPVYRQVATEYDMNNVGDSEEEEEEEMEKPLAAEADSLVDSFQDGKPAIAHDVFPQSESFDTESYESDEEDEGSPLDEPNRALPVVKGSRPCDPKVDNSLFDAEHSVLLTNDSFQEFMEEHEVVFVDFYAPWCIWSQKLAPIWKEFADVMADDSAKIAQVDCVASPDLCRKEGIIAFPTLRLYHKGRAMSPDYKQDRTVMSLYVFVQRFKNGSIKLDVMERLAEPPQAAMKPLDESLSHSEESEKDDRSDEEELVESNDYEEVEGSNEAENEAQSIPFILPRWMKSQG